MLYPGGGGQSAVSSQPVFSVVIPAYNAASTIGEAVESALTQTLRPHEVIVCDDGSTDNLESALSAYRDRITLIGKENGGEGSAKDAASRAATGEFVVILDADDAFLPKRLEALAELARARPDLDILTTDAYLEAGGETLRRVYGEGWEFEVEDQRLAILQRNFIFGAAAVRRERLLAVGGFDPTLRYAADWDLWIRMLLAGSAAGLVQEPLYRYRVGPTALSSRRAPLIRGFVRVLERAAARPDLRPEERDAVKRAIAERRRELVRLELEEALGSRTRVRARAARALQVRGVSARAKRKALVAMVTPELAARVQESRQRGRWVGAGGTLVASRPATKLVAYTDSEETGGAEVSLGHVLAGLDSKYDVTVMGVSESVVSRLASIRPGTRGVVLAPVRRKHDLRGVLAHVRAMRRSRPSIVHVSLNTPWACPYGIIGAFAARSRVVLVEQSLFPGEGRLRRSFARIAGRRAAAVVAVGARSAREIERLVGLSPASVRTIHNGVPDVPWLRGEADDTAVIGSVGRLDPEKGFDSLVRALPALQASATLVGDGAERDRLDMLATELGVRDRFAITGWTEDVRRHLASFTVFCLPSRSESFPLSVVEAMLAGLPVVATDVGSVAEAVHHGETGFLVPPNDVDALADALRRLLDDPELRGSMGARGRELALERFTAERMVASFEALYEELQV